MAIISAVPADEYDVMDGAEIHRRILALIREENLEPTDWDSLLLNGTKNEDRHRDLIALLDANHVFKTLSAGWNWPFVLTYYVSLKPEAGWFAISNVTKPMMGQMCGVLWRTLDTLQCLL